MKRRKGQVQRKGTERKGMGKKCWRKGKGRKGTGGAEKRHFLKSIA